MTGTKTLTAALRQTGLEIAPRPFEITRDCPKCGQEDILVAWHGEGAYHDTRRSSRCFSDYGETHGNPKHEHLHYRCRTCQFQWEGPVKA